MARVEVTQYYDDLDKTPLQESEVNVVEFSYNGIHYSLDLSAENTKKFTDLLLPYIEVATRIPRPQQRAGRRSGAGQGRRNPERNKKIRAWAQEQGLSISKRGQISQDIIDAYDAHFLSQK